MNKKVFQMICRCLDLYSGYCIPVVCLYSCWVAVYLQGVCILVGCLCVGCDYGVRPPARRGLCACRRRCFSSKNMPREFWNMYFVDVMTSERFQGPLIKQTNKRKQHIVCSNDYASKTRIEILYKKTCYNTPIHFPKSESASNSLIFRTLV